MQMARGEWLKDPLRDSLFGGRVVFDKGLTQIRVHHDVEAYKGASLIIKRPPPSQD